MKTMYRLPIRLYGLLLLMGAMTLALVTTATGRTPLADPLVLIQPTYNCTTGAITFNTTGGDGSTITYSAPGITGPTTNPNQFVDAGLRQAADAQPLTLSATQSGVTVTYRFDLRATCPIGTNPPVQPNNDRAILVEFYNATNGPGWNNKTNWLQGDSPCNWFGVTCDGNGRVTELVLGKNNLTGTLPASVGNLSQLKGLSLFENKLGGSIPASIGNLVNVQYLILDNNQFSSNIPASLGNLSQVSYLQLSNNLLSNNIPSELSNLPKLISLMLFGNQLSGSIPTSLGSLPNLTTLDLSRNHLSGSIPASLGNSKQLYNLILTNNELSGCFPSELASLCGKGVRMTGNPGLPGGGDFASFCSNRTGACPTTPITGNFTLIAPTYNCTTGAITFNTTGGNGSPITYQAPGIIRSAVTDNTGYIETGLRNDPKPITISATQSGQTVSYTFDFGAFCRIRPTALPPVLVHAIASQTLTVGQPVVGRSIDLGSAFLDPTVVVGPYMSNWQIQINGIPFGLTPPANDQNLSVASPQLYLTGTPTATGVYTLTVIARTASFPDQPVGTTFTITVFPAPIITGTLTLLAPTYNCSTGAITFNTTGGNGTLIEYQAPGITGWTTNPNQFVDQASRTANDVQPFTLMARQSGTVVTYTWNLKQACGRARVAAQEAGTTLSLQLLGNPVHESVQVLIKGAEGQPVQLRLTDVRGRLLESRAIEQAGAEEVQQFRLDPSAGPGMLFLQATQHQQIKTVRILRQ